MDDVQPCKLCFSLSELRKVMRAGLREVPLVTHASSGGSNHGLFLSLVAFRMVSQNQTTTHKTKSASAPKADQAPVLYS
jgi:hypothetical protein